MKKWVYAFLLGLAVFLPTALYLRINQPPDPGPVLSISFLVSGMVAFVGVCGIRFEYKRARQPEMEDTP